MESIIKTGECVNCGKEIQDKQPKVTVNEWRKSSSTSPNKSGTYWAFCVDGSVLKMYWDDDGEGSGSWNRRTGLSTIGLPEHGVTHWKEKESKPEPPKEEENAQDED